MLHTWLRTLRTTIKEGKTELNVDEFAKLRAINISAIVIYSKFFGVNKEFRAKIVPRKLYSSDQLMLHEEIYELRNKVFAHIDNSKFISMDCIIKVDEESGEPFLAYNHKYH